LIKSAFIKIGLGELAERLPICKGELSPYIFDKSLGREALQYSADQVGLSRGCDYLSDLP